MSSNAQSVINELNYVIGGFTSQVDAKIDTIDKQTAITRQTADSALEKIHTFKEQMIADEQMQSAHENILRLDQVIREKFESNIKVRKTVSGVVKDFDINLCRNSTIAELSEELWITSSRYWLSFALIAISAWVNDSKALANNAINESVRANEIKSNLFFCLVNLRFGRLDAAKKWLTEYFKAVVPDEMKDETAILLQSYINGVFGTDKSLEYEVQSIVDEWVKTVNLDENLSAELVADFEGYIEKINVGRSCSCPILSKYCSTASELQVLYIESFKYEKLIELVESLDVELIVQNASNYKQRIDAIVSDLITNYDEEEQEIKNQREYYQLIMDNKGNMEAAEQQYEERMRVRNQTQNIGRKLLDWAIYKNSNEVDIHVRKFAFQNAKEWFLRALENWSSAFEAKFPTSYPIKIDDWSCVSNGEDQYELEQNFREHLEEHKYQKMYFNKPNITLLVWLLIFVAGGLAITLYVMPNALLPEWGTYVAYALFGLAAVFAVIIAIRCATAGRKFRKMVNEKLDIFAGCMSELTEIRKVYFENIQNKNKLFNLTEYL